MSKNEKNTVWLTRTALCTALVLLAQIVGKFLLPPGLSIYGPFTLNQLATGTLVNLVLIVSAANIGLSAGIACGLISSILATLLGMTPVPFITPAIAIGNVIIAVAAWYFFGVRGSSSMRGIGVAVGAVLKCAWLWFSVPLILELLPNIAEKQAKMLSIMFSWPQFITAALGGALALVVYQPIKKALGSQCTD